MYGGLILLFVARSLPELTKGAIFKLVKVSDADRDVITTFRS